MDWKQFILSKGCFYNIFWTFWTAIKINSKKKFFDKNFQSFHLKFQKNNLASYDQECWERYFPHLFGIKTYLREYPRKAANSMLEIWISTDVVLREGDGWVWVVDLISDPDLSFWPRPFFTKYRKTWITLPLKVRLIQKLTCTFALLWSIIILVGVWIGLSKLKLWPNT